MAHMMETMFYVGATPWHGLGKKLETPPEAGQAIIEAGLDWEIQTQPIFAKEWSKPVLMMTENGPEYRGGAVDESSARIESHNLIRRTSDGEIFGVVGKNWTPVQNRDAFGFFDPLVQSGMATYHTAGSLNGGRIVWILAQIGEELNVIGDDNIGQFLLLSMGHDGVRGINVQPTPIRVVCANTLSMADRQAAGQSLVRRFNHTANVHNRLEDFRDFLKPHLADYESTVEIFRRMAYKDADSGMVDSFLNSVFPDPVRDNGTKASTSRVEKVRESVLNKFEGELIGWDALPVDRRKSVWTMYQAVTEYVDHERGRTDDSRLRSAWLGDGAGVKRKALVTAQSLMARI